MKNPIVALDASPRTKPSNYPEPFADRMNKRVKRQLGDIFDIKSFGVNLTELKPGAESALLHKHSLQEEFIYILSGYPTLVLEDREYGMSPDMCYGFTPEGPAHQLVNRSTESVLYLEVGSRIEGDEGFYPKDDLLALQEKGKWIFTRKDGSPY